MRVLKSEEATKESEEATCLHHAAVSKRSQQRQVVGVLASGGNGGESRCRVSIILGLLSNKGLGSI